MIELLPSSSLRTLLRRAARVSAACLRGEEVPDEMCPDPLLEREGGAFVTLTRRGQLAGCIGYVQSPWPLWDTVAQAARGAALEDPRFDRLPVEALPEVEVEISVLTPSVPIEAAEVEVGRHGLIIDCHHQRGLLLPQVAVEHHLDREAFLDALCRKAGLPPGEWRRPECRLEAFEAQLDKGRLLELCGEEAGDGEVGGTEAGDGEVGGTEAGDGEGMSGGGGDDD